MKVRPFSIWLLSLGLLGLVSPVAATERRFTYTYGSDVLNRGSVELEPWTTIRIGRQDYYRRFDHRIELEVGVTDRLQTAWYLQWSAVAQDVNNLREVDSEWAGVAWEWKYKLTDAVASPLGCALYLEPGVSPDEAELEAKLILDRRSGPWYAAANATLEQEWKFETEGTESETAIEVNLGATHFLTPSFSLGLEARNHNEVVESEWEHSALFLGPVVSYSSGSWWSTVTILPQIAALKGETSGGLVLDEHEKLEVRILWGVDL